MKKTYQVIFVNNKHVCMEFEAEDLSSYKASDVIRQNISFYNFVNACPAEIEGGFRVDTKLGFFDVVEKV